MQETRQHPPQTGLLTWLEDRGIRHRWAAEQIGYRPEYFSRILTGSAPLTGTFQAKCETILQVPPDVWRV